MTPKKQVQIQGKRARESGSSSDQDGDTIYLEMLGRISALESKDKENTKRLETMQSDLDQANAEISLLREQVRSLEESLKFTQAEHEEVKERVNTCEEEQMRNEDELIRQNIYSRRWNLIIYGIEESETENCTAQVKNVMLSSLKINEEIVNSTKFCGVHRLGKSKQISGKPRPVIARFTCREDRELVWRQRYNLKGSRYSLAEDLPPGAVRKIRKTILEPAMKEARKTAGTRATIIGDNLIVNGKRYTFDKIPKKWSGHIEG